MSDAQDAPYQSPSRVVDSTAAQDALTVAQRLSECAGARDWSTTQAALWWQAHLPDLSAGLAPAADAPTRS